ncbi:MAG: type II toxin-antitoxin system Phd/YefM family antitoxin [Comamonadaceae bacterium]|nr:MAG: type II toxin-antitoxin system Phd/YefM family antitoxin [Comamonadaceae bacterium]
MNTLQIREAKAGFSALVADAEHGRPTLITRHGVPTAMVVPVDAGRRLFPIDTPSLASHLLAMPEALPAVERDTTPLREVEL